MSSGNGVVCADGNATGVLVCVASIFRSNKCKTNHKSSLHFDFIIIDVICIPNSWRRTHPGEALWRHRRHSDNELNVLDVVAKHNAFANALRFDIF